MNIDLYTNLPEKIPESNTILEKCLQRSKLVLIPKRFGKTIIVNRMIKVDENLGALLGFHLSDGLSSRKSRSYVTMRFTNTDITIISSFLKAIERSFGLKRKEFVYVAHYNPTYTPDFERVGDEWKTKLKLDKICKYYVQNDTIKFKLNVIFHSVALRFIIDHLCSKISNFMKNESFVIGFLKAIIAAEGNIYLREKSVKEIFIAQNDDENRMLFETFLKKLKINYVIKIADKRSGIRISGYDTFKKIDNYSLCSLSLRKNTAFKVGFENLKKTYKRGRKDWTRKKIVDLLSENPMTATEIAEKTNLSYYTIIEYLNGKRSGINNKIEPLQKSEVKIGRPAIIWRLKNE